MNPYLEAIAAVGLGSSHPGGFAHTLEILKNMSISPDDVVIEIGCGIGRTACHMAKTYGAHVFALDNSGEMLARARETAQKEGVEVHFVQGDARDLPFLDGVADVIFIESVLLFLPPGDVIKECRRVLKKGGLIVNVELFAESSFPESARQALAQLCGVQNVPGFGDWEDFWTESGFLPLIKLRRNFPGHLDNLRNIIHMDPISNWLAAGTRAGVLPVIAQYRSLMESNRQHLGYGTYIMKRR